MYDSSLTLPEKRAYLAAHLQDIGNRYFAGQAPIEAKVRDNLLSEVSISTYVNVFGSWNKAVAAAGFTPRNRGGQPGKRGPNCRTLGKIRQKSQTPHNK